MDRRVDDVDGKGADRRGAVNDLLRNVAQIDPQILQTILVAHRVENFVDADAAEWLRGFIAKTAAETRHNFAGRFFQPWKIGLLIQFVVPAIRICGRAPACQCFRRKKPVPAHRSLRSAGKAPGPYCQSMPRGRKRCAPPSEWTEWTPRDPTRRAAAYEHAAVGDAPQFGFAHRKPDQRAAAQMDASHLGLARLGPA